jgi:hypothetical protein
MATYVKIAGVDVGVLGAANINFASIPSTFTDLVIKLSGRVSAASEFITIRTSINASSSNFSSRVLQGEGSGVGTGSFGIFAGQVGGSLSTTNTFNSLDIYYANYTAAINKSFNIDSVVENNATAGRTTIASGLWSDTSAINQITLTPDSGSFVQYSTATLYGIKKA